MRKYNNKWRVEIERKGVRISRSFTKKQLASDWANKVEAEIINGTYQDNNELIKISVRELIDLYYDHTKQKTEHEKRLRDECNLITI